MTINRTTEIPATTAAHPTVLTCECSDTAYGVSVIPWEKNIRMIPPPKDMGLNPRMKGFIAVTDRLVPVFDLREETDSPMTNSKAKSYVLIISMGENVGLVKTMALLVNHIPGGLILPKNLMINLASSN